MSNTATPQAKQFTEPGVTIVQGDALALDLPDDSVDLVVTSPPYFGLRSYQDGGEHYDGQIGAEATPAEFVDALIAATREMVRVVKPSGSIWVNLGDKYAGSNGQPGGAGSSTLVGTTSHTRGMTSSKKPPTGAPTKSLIGIPWRYAIRCIDDLGLILRANVIWSKPNGLPESVTDRVRRSHEDWFHFTLNPRYYSAVDEIREEHRSEPGREGKGALGGQKSLRPVGPGSGTYNPLGKLPGSVWTVATEPLHVPDHLGVDHFAAFPTEWPRRIIQGWSPRGICVECGEGRRPVVDRKPMEFRPSPRNLIRKDEQGTALIGNNAGGTMLSPAETTITGEACACVIHDERHCVLCLSGEHKRELPPTRPAVVLDPFGGTGTTALVAEALGRHGISNDMSADYCRLARWRTSDPKQRDKAAS